MKSSAARKFLASGIAALALTVFAGDALSQGATASSFRYPVRDSATGRKTADIAGDSASDTAEGWIVIKGLRLFLYGVDDRTNALVEASDCVCKLKDQAAESDSDVRIESSNILITGRGFLWRAGDHFMKIKSRVRVEIGPAVDLGAYVASPGN